MPHDAKLYPHFQAYLDRFNTDEPARTHQLLYERFHTDFPSSAFGIVRHEIRNCLIYEMYQAALTLTNHYLERFLKVALIKSQTTAMMTDYEQFNAEHEQLIKKYGGQGLSHNLKAALQLGILSQDQYQVLDAFRVNFRNTFSHFDNSKITPDQDVKLTQFSFSQPGPPISSGSINMRNLSFSMGHFDYEFAKEHALVYFLSVDDLAMRFEIKQSPRLVTIIKEKTGIDVEKVFNQVQFIPTGGTDQTEIPAE